MSHEEMVQLGLNVNSLHEEVDPAELIDFSGCKSWDEAIRVGREVEAALDHMRDWALGTPDGDWVSMAVPSDGSYGVPEGLLSSFPCTTADGKWSIVQGLDIDDFSRGRIDATVAELAEERDTVKDLGLIT